VHFVGNTMIDTLVSCLDKLDAEAVRAAHGLPERYVVATLHRPFNVDSPEAAALLVKAMHEVADMAPVIIPVHPRGRAVFEATGLAEHPGIRMCEPLGYLEFMSLVRGAAAAITDSAGVQEETTFLRVPCLTLATSSPGDRTPGNCRHCGTARPAPGSPASSPAGWLPAAENQGLTSTTSGLTPECGLDTITVDGGQPALGQHGVRKRRETTGTNRVIRA
jgi:hypothetical protein